MKRERRRYNIINSIVLILSLAFFVYEYRKGLKLFDGMSLASVLALIATVVIVHAIKAIRLYLAMYGEEISFSEYIKVYLKVTPVSVVVPFKLGELFRMYCYGKSIKNLLKGIIIVILDRFMDTAALVTAILILFITGRRSTNIIVYILLAFLVLAVFAYFLFPGIYSSWNKYLLRAKASEKKLRALKFLDTLNGYYKEICTVTKGRGAILYFLSLLAWAVEIGSIALLSGIMRGGELGIAITEYLSAAMGTGVSVELNRFVFVSVVLLIISYLLIKGVGLIAGKKGSK